MKCIRLRPRSILVNGRQEYLKDSHFPSNKLQLSQSESNIDLRVLEVSTSVTDTGFVGSFNSHMLEELSLGSGTGPSQSLFRNREQTTRTSLSWVYQKRFVRAFSSSEQRPGRGLTGPTLYSLAAAQKILNFNKALFFEFLDLEKAYDKSSWTTKSYLPLSTSGVTGQLLHVIITFYELCEAAAVNIEGSVEP